MKDNAGINKKAPTPSAQNTNVDDSSTKIDLSQSTLQIDRNNIMMKTKAVKLHVILKKLMKDKGVSSRSLSKECSIPLSTIGSYLSGKKASYSPEHLDGLAQYFNVTLDYLLFGVEKTPTNLDLLPTEDIFQGWLKVKVQRVVPDKSKTNDEESEE